MVTIEDVAREAGVSKSTVSFVINKRNIVKLETKYKVLEAIEKLNYIPNVAAQELITKRKQTLGLVINTAQYSYSFNAGADTYFEDVTNGILKEVVKTPYSILYEQFDGNGQSDGIPAIVRNKRVDGYFIIGRIFESVFINRLLKEKIPFVVINRNCSKVDCAYTDTKFATYMGVKYLLDSGHRDIAFINAPDDHPTSFLKLEGYKLALAEAGIECNPDWIKHSNFSGKGGYDAAKEIWESGVRPTAIASGHDIIIIGAMKFFHQHRISVPEEVSLLGYEDSILTEYSIPGLTTVKINKEKIGMEACRVLLERIANPKTKLANIVVPPQLIVRESVQQLGK